MDHSWDEDSRAEYLEWVRSKNATQAQLLSCAELWSILKNDILLHGPGLLIQYRRIQVERNKEESVLLYSLKRNEDVEMCFAYKDNHVHLVFIGPHDNSDNSWGIAIERAERWNI